MFRLTAIAALLLASTAATADQFTIKASSAIASNADTLVLLISPDQLDANPQLEAISKQENFKAAHGTTLTWLAPASPYSQYQRVLLLGTGETEKLTPYQASLLGAAAARTLKGSAASIIQLDTSLINTPFSQTELLAQLSHGVDLASYTFSRYHSDKKPETVRNLHLLSNEQATAEQRLAQLTALSEGVKLARDLTNEPASGIYPETFAKQALELRKLGAKVTVMDEKALEKAGLGAILAVGRVAPGHPAW